LVLLALGPTLGGYGLYMISLSHLPAATANLIVTLEPAITAALAFFLLGERLVPVQLLGAGLILGGVVLVYLSVRAAAISRGGGRADRVSQSSLAASGRQ